MKAKTLLTAAKKELNEESSKKVLVLLKKQIKEIEDCKKTLRRLEKEHKKVLNMDVADLEADGFIY